MTDGLMGGTTRPNHLRWVIGNHWIRQVGSDDEHKWHWVLLLRRITWDMMRGLRGRLPWPSPPPLGGPRRQLNHQPPTTPRLEPTMGALGKHSAPQVGSWRGIPLSKSSWLRHESGQEAWNHAFQTRPEEVTLGWMMAVTTVCGWKMSGSFVLGGKRIIRPGMPRSPNLRKRLGMSQSRTSFQLIPNHA